MSNNSKPETAKVSPICPWCGIHMNRELFSRGVFDMYIYTCPNCGRHGSGGGGGTS